MTLDEFRQHMKKYWLSVLEEANEAWDQSIARERMKQLYAKFDPAERAMADQVIVEWALSGDESMRFDALRLIDSLKVVTALPALRVLVSRLESSRERGTGSDLGYVNRILAESETWPGQEKRKLS